MNGEVFSKIIVCNFAKISNLQLAIIFLELNEELKNNMESKNDLKYKNWNNWLRNTPIFFHFLIIEYGQVGIIV